MRNSKVPPSFDLILSLSKGEVVARSSPPQFAAANGGDHEVVEGARSGEVGRLGRRFATDDADDANGAAC